jgi:hypothetical protein
MLTLYVRIAEDRLEIGRGESRAQFERQDNYWVPLWMWQGDQRVLRFKNHEWFALGHVHPRAHDWEIIEDTADKVLVRFLGQDSFFGVPVEWSVWVGADIRWPGFTITTEITPAQTIELFECFSRFETPADYDGQEEILCMIGQGPVAFWRGGEWVTPRPNGLMTLRGIGDQVACAAITRTPTCCIRMKTAEQGSDRYMTLLGHWDTCCFRNVAVAPSDFVDHRRAYEFLIGTLDTRCGPDVEPNVFFEGDNTYRQCVSMAFFSEIPGGTYDRWFYGAFERSLRQHFPSNAVMEIEQRLHKKTVTLAEAGDWLLKMIAGTGIPGLYSPDQGIVDYVEGTSPDAGRFSLAALAPWLEVFGYRCYVMRRDDLRTICEQLAERVSSEVEKSEPATWKACPLFHEILPLLHYLSAFPNDSLQLMVRQVLGRALETFPPEKADDPRMALGHEVFHAEAYLLAGQMSGDQRLLDAGFACLERINAAAGDQFWRFGCGGESDDTAMAARMRPLAYGHAILCNLIAYQRSHNERHMEMAGTFARYLVSMCYGTFNDSPDPDFDARGFANAALSGCQRLVECAPMETSDSLRCMAYWLGFRSDNPASFYDLLWLLGRTFCGVFPAAREQRYGCDTEGRPVRYRNEELPAAIAYLRFPYIAYENPIRQTRLSPRASVEALQNHLTFGGGLASCDNERLLVLAPRAAGYDLAERIGRLVHVYNPSETSEVARLAVHHLSPRRQFEVTVGDERIAAGLAGDALTDIAVQVPPRRAVVVEVTPSRQPTSF